MPKETLLWLLGGVDMPELVCPHLLILTFKKTEAAGVLKMFKVQHVAACPNTTALYILEKKEKQHTNYNADRSRMSATNKGFNTITMGIHSGHETIHTSCFCFYLNFINLLIQYCRCSTWLKQPFAIIWYGLRLHGSCRSIEAVCVETFSHLRRMTHAAIIYLSDFQNVNTDNVAYVFWDNTTTATFGKTINKKGMKTSKGQQQQASRWGYFYCT